ncbi:MAG: hypothetical protein RL021_2023 [Bacteroidota bacterium]
MRIFSVIICLLLATPALAQTGEIRGFVYEQETSEPAIYTSVYLKGTSLGSQTNLDGFFNISRVPAGDYELMITMVGFDTIRVPITVKSGDFITRKLFLKKSAIQIKELEVTAESEEKRTDVRVSVNRIVPKEIKQLPSVGGEPDLAQYLQVLPGVISSGDQGGQLYIRGGTPIQNKLLLDGMVIYNPFHSIGLFSVIDPDIIRGADIYTGGYNAEYGDRISSIMDITTRDGNKQRVSGKVGINTFSGKVILEGPLSGRPKGKSQEAADENMGRSSFLISARTSFLDRSSTYFYPYAGDNGIPFSFSDLYGKLSFNGSSGSKVNFFGFHFTDNADYTSIATLNWKSSGIGGNFVAVPSGSSTLVDGNFAYSNYGIEMSEAGASSRYSDIGGFNAGFNFTNFKGRSEIKYGLDVAGIKTNYLFTNYIGTQIEQDQNSTQGGSYLKAKLVSDRWVVEPGIRFGLYASLAEISIEPRLGVKYKATDRLRFKAAGGYYAQNLMAGTSDRDVVNLFYSFLTGSDNLPSTFDGEVVTSRLQRARHAIAGFELDLPWHLNLNIEAYLKEFIQLQNINRDKLYDDDPQHFDKPDALKKDFIIENGLAKGVDVLLNYDYNGLYVWAVYSLAYVQRYDGFRTYWPSFDRRHNVNFLASYSFGKDRCWMTSVRWNFGSPFPFTQSAGYYEQLVFDNGIGTDLTNQNGQLYTIFGPLNEGRLSYFHRLDASVQRTFKFGRNTRLDVNAGVTNGYDRKNIFYVNRFTAEKIYQLPILPNLGLTMTF